MWFLKRLKRGELLYHRFLSMESLRRIQRDEAQPVVYCAMSGGVDSTMVAILLKEGGFKIRGVFMRTWDEMNERGECSGDEDKRYAQLVADRLDFPLIEIDVVKEYWNFVFERMLAEYASGTTPNPDILCNEFIKFDYLFRKLEKVGSNRFYLATGHYADTDDAGRLLVPKDSLKDQTFFLSRVSNRSLIKTVFPLADKLKRDVTENVRNAFGGAFSAIASKKESMGVCFIGKRRKFREFLAEYLTPLPGDFIDYDSGKVVGQHEGFHAYTIGQRSRLTYNGHGMYVASKHPKTNQIIVAKGFDHPALISDHFSATDFKLIYPDSVDESWWANLSGQGLACRFRFQHIHPTSPCHLRLLGSGGLVSVQLPIAQRAITPGQFAVFYSPDDTVCIGSARIVSTTFPPPSAAEETQTITAFSC